MYIPLGHSPDADSLAPEGLLTYDGGVIRSSVDDKCPGFSGFCRKLVRTKNQQLKEKLREYNGRKVFPRVSKGVVTFVLYTLSSIHYTYSLFATTSIFASTSPPTPDEALTATEHICRSPHFRIHICRCACRRLQQSPPFSLT